MPYTLSRSIAPVVLLALLPVLPLSAQNPPGGGTVLEPSGLEFRVLGQQTGSFVIATPGDNQPVNYDLNARRISFQTLDFVAGIVNPLFCFDFSSPGAGGSAQLRLDVSSSSAHPALASVPVTSALQYRLSGGAIEYTPGFQTQCFYIGDTDEPTFGLFGALPPPPREPVVPEPDPDVVFQDTFEIFVDSGLDIRFVGVPQAVTAGGLLSYRMVVENTGDLDLGTVAFQEAFPGNANVFPAALDAGSWTCSGTGATCPAANGNGVVRVSGVALPVGSSLEFQITRPVAAASAGGSTIELYAGAVNGPGSNAVFGVDQASVAVIGAPARIVFVNDGSPVDVGGQKTLSIEIQDAGGNLVATDSRILELSKVINSGPGQVTPMTGLIQISNGVVSFEVTGTVPGGLTLAAQTQQGAPFLQTGLTTFSVTAP